MASLYISSSLPSSSSSKRVLTVNSSINVPKSSLIPLSSSSSSNSKLPSRKLFEELNGFSHSNLLPSHNNTNLNSSSSSSSSSSQSHHEDLLRSELYVILEAVADRIEMHHNIGEQRDNWNTLLLNSINMITLSGSTIAAVAGASAAAGAPILALKLSAGLLFSAATAMLAVMNKIQPSQLAEEQRNATRLFRQIHNEIQTKLAIGKMSDEEIRVTMAKILALDKAYPLPLLGAMIEKFPKKFEHAKWWPSTSSGQSGLKSKESENGWSEGLEIELKEVMEVVKKKDIEDYERLGNLVLRINKGLAIAGPVLTAFAAVGSLFISSESSWSAAVPAVAGALSTAINGFEHGGQLGMVAEMYRNCAGFFQMLDDSVKETVEEDVERRENGELFEMKLALKLGRSLSQLRDLAKKSAYSRVEGADVDEFASKLF